MEQVTAVVDFGTSHTVVVASGPGMPARLVPVDGEPWFPSAVFWGRDGRGVVGRDAVRLGRAEPARLERRPKARLGEKEVLLGDAVVPAHILARHVLVRAVAEVVTLTDAEVGHLVLTHPADWGPTKLGTLLTAAQGLVPRVSTVAEPVAAAAWFATENELPIDAMLAVLDFGGGTCDVALVRREASGLTVAACAGLPDLGGDDLDQRIVDRLAAGREELARLLKDAHLPDAELAGLSRFRDDVRAAKEVLSRHPQADLVLPGDLPDALLTRAEFEEIVRPDLDRAVELLDSTVRSAGLSGSDLAAVQLVGGSSRVPLLAQLLQNWTTTPVRLDDQPEAVVALGAEVVTRAPATPERVPEPGEVTGPVRITQKEPAQKEPAQKRRRATTVAVAVMVVAVLGLAGVVGVRLFDGSVGGSAHALPGGPWLAAPAHAPGRPVVVPGRSTAALPQVQPGQYVPYVYQDSNIQWRLDSFDDSDETGRKLTELGNELAPGQHWILVRYTVLTTAALPGAPDVGGQVYVVDDRGLMISAVDSFISPANSASVTLPEDCPEQVTDPVAAGVELPSCALYAVPDTTPVTEVAVAYHANAHPLPSLDESTVRRGARVAVDAREAAGDPPAPPGKEHVRGSAVPVHTNSLSGDLAVADVVEDGSTYFDDDTTIILAGSRALVLRMAVRLDKAVPGSSLFDISVALLDDRGAPVDPSVTLQTNECVNTLSDNDVSGLVTMCVLFAMPTDATPSAAVVRVGAGTDPVVWSLR